MAKHVLSISDVSGMTTSVHLASESRPGRHKRLEMKVDVSRPESSQFVVKSSAANGGERIETDDMLFDNLIEAIEAYNEI